MAKSTFVYVTYIRTTPESWPMVIFQLEILVETGSSVLQNPYPIKSAHPGKE